MSRIAEINRNFPIAQHLTEHLNKTGNLRGLSIGWHCHLTDLTAIAVDTLIDAGARVTLSECNSDTTEVEAVDYMRERGAKVFIGDAAPLKTLEQIPHLISDTGFVLIEQALEQLGSAAPPGSAGHLSGTTSGSAGALPGTTLFAASEITTSGITKLRARTNVPLPVVNVNDGHLKNMIENFHGVGDGLIDALNRTTGVMWAGRRAVVVGYGRVGAGVAEYLRRAGAVVTVCETMPMRRLSAHYDGFTVGNMKDCLRGAGLVVTATGSEAIMDSREWALLSDGTYVFNVGHWAEEINRSALVRDSVEMTQIGDYIEKFSFADGRSIYLATHGSPANVAMNSGSPEPTLIHLTTEMLCLDYLAGCLRENRVLAAGELPVPQEVEETASIVGLRALGLN